MYSIQYLFKKILFPTHCIVCKKGSESLCHRCMQNLHITMRVIKLPHCTEITFLQYQHPSVAKIIWELKYKNNHELRTQIVQFLAPYAKKEIDYILQRPTDFICIAVPKTTYDHTKKRDFDHAHQLAHMWKQVLPYTITIPYGYLVKKSHKRQVEHIKRSDRITAAKNSIQSTSVLQKCMPTNTPLCIIDDVTTTGATRDEMIRVLKPFFTGPIIFLALAH